MSSKRIFACLVIMTALPFLASSSQDKSSNPTPFATIAIAGHVVTGGGAWCQCGCAGCICDPGETPGACTNSINPVTKKSDGSLDQNASFDFGSSALVLALAVLVWARFLRT